MLLHGTEQRVEQERAERGRRHPHRQLGEGPYVGDGPRGRPPRALGDRAEDREEDGEGVGEGVAHGFVEAEQAHDERLADAGLGAADVLFSRGAPGVERTELPVDRGGEGLEGERALAVNVQDMRRLVGCFVAFIVCFGVDGRYELAEMLQGGG